MRRVLITVLATIIMSGCTGSKPVPAGRLMQPAGKFSFVTPDGWVRSEVAGIDFVIVSTEPDGGVNPNIFVEGTPRSGNVRDEAAQMISAKRASVRAYAVLRQEEFATEAGLRGVKISARRETKDALPVSLYHFLLQDGDRAIGITCSCAETVKQKYEPIFDAAMTSVRSER